MTASFERVVVVGAGQAGAWVARTLRAEGFAGQIVLVGEERVPPYERPPLSKDILAGKATLDSAVLLPWAEAANLNIDLRLGWQARHLHLAARTLVNAGGERLQYDRLVLATGARPRALPLTGVDADRVHVLREAADGERLALALKAGGRLAIIGGGWIGLEVAATARAQGLAVTVVEAGPRLCGRSAPPCLSEFLLGLHRANGVDVHLGAMPQGFAMTADGRVAFTVGGDAVVADAVLMGIGAAPNDELARSAGLDTQDGVIVDRHCRTSDPFVFAAGDVTRQPDWLSAGATMRLETWANAQNQGIACARALLGQDQPYREVPWLWSDQFDCNFQIVGSPERGVKADFEGDLEAHKAFWTLRDGQGEVVGAVAVNAPRALRGLRKLLVERLA